MWMCGSYSLVLNVYMHSFLSRNKRDRQPDRERQRETENYSFIFLFFIKKIWVMVIITQDEWIMYGTDTLFI